MEWTGLSILSFPQVGFPHGFSIPRKYCMKTPQPDTLFPVWLPSSTCYLPPPLLELLVPDRCVVSGELSPCWIF